MKKISFCLLSMMLVGFLYAQPPSKKEVRREKRAVKKEARLEKKAQNLRYMILGSGASFGIIQDLQMSSLTHQGWGGNFTWQRLIIRPKDREEITWFRGVASFMNPPYGDVGAFQATGQAKYNYTRNLYSWNGDKNIIRLGGYVGIPIYFRNNPRLGNSSLYFDILPTIGPSADLQMKFKIPWVKTAAIFAYQIQSSLFGFVNAFPEYATVAEEGYSKFVILGQSATVFSEAALMIPLRKENDNLLKISYAWDLYGLNDNDIHRTRQGLHSLQLALMINLHSPNNPNKLP
ncbi:MAG: hypothetical protein AAFY71_09995 [Bacteroidota bacterium]